MGKSGLVPSTQLSVALPVPSISSCKTLGLQAAAGLTSLTVIPSWRDSTAYLTPPTRVLVSLPLLSLPRRQTDNLRAEKLDLDTVYMIVLVVFSERME